MIDLIRKEMFGMKDPKFKAKPYFKIIKNICKLFFY